MISIILKNGAEIPKYETENAVGLDITANNIITLYKGHKEAPKDTLTKLQEIFESKGYVLLHPFERILIGSGIIVADMPKNIELQIRSRSGMALKKGLMVANGVGTIDPDYRGEIGIILYNSTPHLNRINKNEKIVQLVPSIIHKEEFGKTTEIIPTKRGGGAFGSTD